jgi:hypothetical protein
MNSFITYLARGDHSLQLAAHLAAGILSLLLLSGAARPNAAASSDRVADARGNAPVLAVAQAPGR